MSENSYDRQKPFGKNSGRPARAAESGTPKILDVQSKL
jgi:hypothetical protein